MPTRGSRSDSRDDTASSPREQRRRDAASKAAGGRGRSGKSASSQPLELQIREFPSSCVFLNKEYTVKVFAMDARKTLHRHPVPLELVLFYANGLEVPRGEVARVSPFRMSDETGMCAEVKLTFFTPSLNFKNEKVYFIVRPEGSGGGGGSGSSSPADASASASAATAKRSGGSTPILKPVTSSSVLVVRRRLVVLNKLPEKWFKDQGGRDKHMTVTVEMRDGDDQPVCPSTPVPLRVQVGYENSEELADSRILLLMGDPVQTPEIGSDGRAEVRFRIQEVSSGHRRQRFCLVVEPDIEAAPLNADIAGARSSAVDVRSKVPNKVKRKNSAVSSSSGGGGGGGGGTMSPMGTRSPLDATDGLHGGQYSPGGSVDVADAKRPRHHHHRTGHPERPTLTGTGLGQTMRGALDVYPAGIGGELAGLGGGRTAEESWMLASIEVLRKIEWQMIGYGVDGTGNMNYAEKIYRCPSCYRCSEPHTDDCPLHIAILHYDRLFSGGGGGGGGGGSGGGGVSRGAHATGALAGGGGRAPVQRLISDGNAGLAALSRLPSIPNPYALFGGATKRGGVVAGIVGSGGGGGGGAGGGSGVGGVGGGASSGGDSSRETWMPAQPDDGFRTLSSAVSPKRSSSSNNNSSNGRRNGSSGRSSGSSSSGSRGRTGGGSGSTGGGSSSANGGRGGLAAGAPVPSDAVVGRVVRDHSLGAPLMDDFGGTGAARVLRNTSITTFELQNVAPITVDIKPRGSSSSAPSGSAAGGPGPSGGSGTGSASASGGAGGTRGEGGKGGRHHHAQSRRHGAGSSSRRHDGGDDDARHQVVVDDDDVVGVGDDSGGPDSLGVGVGGAPAMSRAESIISLANLSNNL